MNIKSLLKIQTLTTLAALFCAANPLRLTAATANVSVINDSFSPASTNISVNDTVIWTWPSGSNNHNVTSTSSPQAWTASPTENGPVTFSHTFATAGSFPYECTIHASFGMKATITVTAAVVPPTVSLTSPTNGTVFAAPASVTLQAAASDSDGTVTNVQFLIGSTVVSNRTVAPFAATTNLAAGSYTLSAIAKDTNGKTATNSATISVVNPAALTISSLQRTAGSVQFNYAANAGLTYVVQINTNLMSPAWVAISTNQATGNPVTFTDSHATNNPAFYRVERLPNP
jgi:plastocyanin